MSIHKVMKTLLLKDKKQQFLFVMVMSTITATAALSALFPVLFALGIDALSSQDIQKLQLGVKYIIAFGASMLITGVLEQIQWLSFGPLNLRMQRHLTLHVFDHTVRLPYYKLKNMTTYEIGRTVERGLNATRDITSNLTFFLIPTVIELLIASVVITLLLDIWIAALLLMALFIYGAITNHSAKKIKHSTENAMETGIEAWKYGLDGVANAELIQQSGLKDPFMEDFNTKLKMNDSAWLKTFKQRCFYGCMQAAIFGILVLVILWKGALDTIASEMTIGGLVLLNTYIVRLLQPVETFARIYREVQASTGEAKLLVDLLSIDPVRIEKVALEEDSPFSIEIKNMTLLVNEKTLIKNLTFTLKKYDNLYIVGPSGVGKTSLIRMLSCLIYAKEGEYLINNNTINEDNAYIYRSHISVVQQDCLLFDLSLKENIKFGSSATYAEIDEIIEKLGLSAIVERDGYTTVGERGNRLSGGEKQRISFARALLLKPKLLILDEPTSSLDNQNRERISMLLQTIQSDTTIVIVTHDLNSIPADSQVLFLQPTGNYEFATKSDLLTTSVEFNKFVALNIRK